jgi:hypothetical protein
MGSLLPALQCSLCGGAIGAHEPHFRATGDFLPPKDPLRRYANTPMHWACYAKWPERAVFAGRYVEAWREANRRNPFWWAVYDDERVYVAVNPERPIEQASVRLRDVGSDIRVPLPRWAEWLADIDRVTPGLQPLEKQALDAVLPMLRERFPNDHAVVHAIDEDEKRSRRAP